VVLVLGFRKYFPNHLRWKAYRICVIYNTRGVKRLYLMFFFFVLVLGFAINAHAQIILSKKIVWGKPVVGFSNGTFVEKMSIENDHAIDPVTGLPLVSFEVALDDWTGDSISVELVSRTYIDALEIENSVLNGVALPLAISRTVFVEQKRSFLRVFVSPYLASETTGHYKKMSEVSLSINYPKGATQLLKSASSYATQSILAAGKWVKVSVEKSGIHKITYSSLSSMGFSNPAAVKVYGQGGKMLPRSNATYRVDDLTMNAVWHYNNAIYFYAQGPVEWSYDSAKGMFTHKLHDYTDRGYYFLSDVGEEAVVTESGNNNYLTPTYETSTFDAYAYHESEDVNLIHSGSRWLGEKFGSGYKSTYSIDFSFPNTVVTSSGRISNEVVARSSTYSTFSVLLNASETPLQTIGLGSVNLNSSEGAAASERSVTSNFTPDGDATRVSYVYNYSTTDAAGYLDKVDVQVKCQLKVSGTQTSFRDKASVGTDAITKFNIQLVDANTVVWDVTNYTNPTKVGLNGSGTDRWFIYQTNSLKEFVAFAPNGDFPAPAVVENIPNQNLHGLPQADYLIVTVPQFLSDAKRLAELHQSQNGLSVLVVTQNDIFNEFSSGCPDITAIRSFARMFYERAGADVSQMPKYLLLFGDGTYDNRHAVTNNKVLTFESDISLHYTNTYVSDDYFGFLDANEGNSITTDALDIGIGRLTANNTSEAAGLVDKVNYYLSKQANLNWRNSITFVGDDGNGILHMSDADKLAKKVASNHPEFNLTKIYLDAYPKITTSNGKRYPEVNLLVDESIENGTLIFNYTGHGGSRQLAEERIVSTESIQKWTNIDRLPLFVTATCEFSGYDSDELTAGEMILLNAKGGGIALLSTTRTVYANYNFEINNNFYTYALQKDADALPMRLGDICKLTKRATSGTANKMNFSLLGDPALRLATNSLGVEVTQINNVDVSESVDTLKALSVATIAGKIVDGQSNLVGNFNGTATVTVYDKESEVTTLNNEGVYDSNGNPIVLTYNTFQSILFSGTVAVENGLFSTTFKVPKDIRYDVGNGRIAVYATNNSLHAAGCYNQVKIGGYVNGGEDNKGPDLNLWLNDTSFVDGDVVNGTPLLSATVFDQNGINTSNTGIGHDIVMLIDDGDNGRFILNNYFESTLNDYRGGKIQVQLAQLADGEHTLSLRVWDTYNNSTVKTIRFVVNNGSDLQVDNLALYPNPVMQGQDISLSFTHNDPNSAIKVSCTIYAYNGQMVKHQSKLLFSTGVDTETMTIQAVSDSGQPLKHGLYLLKVEMESETGKKAEVSQKIIVSE
jgi:hypothetical protein